MINLFLSFISINSVVSANSEIFEKTEIFRQCLMAISPFDPINGYEYAVSIMGSRNQKLVQFYRTDGNRKINITLSKLNRNGTDWRVAKVVLKPSIELVYSSGQNCSTIVSHALLQEKNVVPQFSKAYLEAHVNSEGNILLKFCSRDLPFNFTKTFILNRNGTVLNVMTSDYVRGP